MNCLQFTLNCLITTVLILWNIIVEVFKFLCPARFRMKNVDNKIVLITGAGHGLGAALAVKFAKRKCRVILWDINFEGLQKTREECRQYISESLVYIYKVDITKRKQVLDTAEKIKSEIGFVDILINNAGVVSGKSILELDEASVERTFNVNVVSHFWTIQAFLPEMLSRNSGQIVSISSLAGMVGINKLSDYCASKFAAIGLQESLLCEIHAKKKSNIQVLTVCPFYINTGMFDGITTDCPILSILNLNEVVSKIEEAILTNGKLLLIPRISYFLNPLKHILPTQGFLNLAQLIQINQNMETFIGRKE